MKGNVSKIVSDKGAASEQYIDATVGTALNNSKEAKEDAAAARTIAQDAFNYSDEALGKIVNAEVIAMQAKDAVENHTLSIAVHVSDSERTEWNGAMVAALSAKETADAVQGDIEGLKIDVNDAYAKASQAEGIAASADALAQTVKNDLSKHSSDTEIHVTEKEKTDLSMLPNTYTLALETNDALNLHQYDETIHTTAEEKENVNNRIAYAQLMATEASAKAEEVREIAVSADGIAEGAQTTALSAKNDAVYATQYALYVENKVDEGLINIGTIKADKTTISSIFFSTFPFEFSSMYNQEIRLAGSAGETLSELSFTFGNGVYQQDYISGLSFDSGDTPTAIDYTDSGILNWVGTDCATSDGLSIFQPSANTHYDIVFYFNGTQFIGLVNGFVPSTGNEAV